MTIAGTLAVAIAAAATAAARRSPPQARVWVTTPDGSQRLAGQSPAPFDAGTASNRLTITVDPSLRYQPMDGFGAAITDSSASVRSAFPAATRDATMRSIFSPTSGLGMSFLRQPIGSSDFVDGSHYTFDDMSAGRTDYALSHFSIAHDEARILPLLRR